MLLLIYKTRHSYEVCQPHYSLALFVALFGVFGYLRENQILATKDAKTAEDCQIYVLRHGSLRIYPCYVPRLKPESKVHHFIA